MLGLNLVHRGLLGLGFVLEGKIYIEMSGLNLVLEEKILVEPPSLNFAHEKLNPEIDNPDRSTQVLSIHKLKEVANNKK